MNRYARINNYPRRPRRNNTPSVLTVILPLIFVVVGIWLIFVSISQKGDNDKFMETAVPVQATCTDVWYTRSGSKHKTTNYYASVDFEYKGITYHLNKVSVNKNTHVGSVITLYVEPDNPSNVRQKYTTGKFVGNIIASVFFIILGTFISIVFMVARIRAKNRASSISDYTTQSGYIPPHNDYNSYQNNSYNNYNHYNPNEIYHNYQDSRNYFDGNNNNNYNNENNNYSDFNNLY